MSIFAIDSQVLVNCYIGCDYEDKVYWFTRNGNAKNASQPLFKKKVFTLPLSLNDLKVALLENLEQSDILHHKFKDGGVDFNLHALLLVQKPKTDRKKGKSRYPIWKHECEVIPETAFFNIGECAEMDIVVVSKATKSHSTNVVGGSSTTPSSVIARTKEAFLAAQIEQIKLQRPLAECFSRLEFSGTKSHRIKAMTALLGLHCSIEELSSDDEILAAGHRCNGSLVLERIKDRITAIGLNTQLPANCAVLRSGKRVKTWRTMEDFQGDYVDEDEDKQAMNSKLSFRQQPSQDRKKIKLERKGDDVVCECNRSRLEEDDDADDRYCGECGIQRSVPIFCCKKELKGNFCTVCGAGKRSASSSMLPEQPTPVEDLTGASSDEE